MPYRGVSHNGKGYRAAVTHEGVRHNLGTFETPEEAALAYNEAATLYKGEFVSLNELPPAFLATL